MSTQPARQLILGVMAHLMAPRFHWYWSERMHRWWERLRTRGAIHFVVIRGVLAWGGSMFAFFTLAPILLDFPSTIRFTPELVFNISVICVTGGLAWGTLTWYTNEFLYRKHTS